MKRAVCVVLALILALSACSTAPSAEPAIGENPVQTRKPMDIHADWIYFHSPEHALDWTDIAFTGKVIGISSKEMNLFADPPKKPDGTILGGALYTIYEVEIDQIYYGEWDKKTIYVASQGGVIDGIEYVWEGAAPVEYQCSYLFLVHTKPSLLGYEEVIPLTPFQAVFELEPEVRGQSAEKSANNPVTYEGLMKVLEKS